MLPAVALGAPQYTKWRPSGRSDGKMWAASLSAGVETGVDAPPAALTCSNALGPLTPKTILPSCVHKPPRTAAVTSHSVCAGPPDASIFWSLPTVENTMVRLSEDQKGTPATPSVPASGRASTESMDRIQIWGVPPPLAMKASLRPSGETAKLSVNATLSGWTMSKRVISAGVAGFGRKYKKAKTKAASDVTAATAGHS